MFDTFENVNRESEPLEKIQLKHLIVAFLILGVGCFVALIVFMIERFWGGMLKETQQVSDSENQNMEAFHTSE